jgi:hypothetical protein
MAKMTRADKKRRKLAKAVEMRLDGIELLWGWRGMSYEELCRHHEHEKFLNRDRQYWGPSLANMVLAEKARELQRDIDRRILEELNGKSK